MRGKKCPRCDRNTMFQLRHIRKCSECGLELVLVFQHGQFVPMPVELAEAARTASRVCRLGSGVGPTCEEDCIIEGKRCPLLPG